uniref:RING-type domain-containing protein n=1 Tax=Acrobeloides nanus TaxID=290746 RepID=A0A914C8J6_9BILA
MVCECAICIEPLEDDISTTRCGHIAHTDCLLIWILQAGTCPTCRQPALESDLIRLYVDFRSVTNISENKRELYKRTYIIEKVLSLWKSKYPHEEGNKQMDEKQVLFNRQNSIKTFNRSQLEETITESHISEEEKEKVVTALYLALLFHSQGYARDFDGICEHVSKMLHELFHNDGWNCRMAKSEIILSPDMITNFIKFKLDNEDFVVVYN